MRSRRIVFFILWAVSLWAVLYSGMAVFYYGFLLFSIVCLFSLVQLILSFWSFSLRTNISVHAAEKGQPFTWKLLPKAIHLPIAHVKISIRNPTISDSELPLLNYYISPSFRKTTPVRISITASYCGMFPLEVAEVEIFDIFGLWHIRVSPAHYLNKNPIYVTVLPDASASLHSDLLYDEIALPLRRTRERAEAVGVREYMRGDNMRSIHWKYSARIGKLHVKEYEKGAKEQHLIYLDLTDTPLTGEAAVQCKDQMLCSAASLCHVLLKEQIPLVILSYSSRNKGRFSLVHANDWDPARLFLAQREFVREIPSEYKETVAGFVLGEKSTLTVFTMAVTATSLSFLTYRAGDYSSVSVCFIPQEGYDREQQAIAHLLSDKGIQTSFLPAAKIPAPKDAAPKASEPDSFGDEHYTDYSAGYSGIYSEQRGDPEAAPDSVYAARHPVEEIESPSSGSEESI